MAPISSLRRDQYKLRTTFDSESTIHTIVLEGGSKSTRETQVCLKWRHKKDIGAGGFGTVWLEEEEDGQLRAVKRLPQYVRNADWSRELEILAQLKNASSCFPQRDIPHNCTQARPIVLTGRPCAPSIKRCLYNSSVGTKTKIKASHILRWSTSSTVT